MALCGPKRGELTPIPKPEWVKGGCNVVGVPQHFIPSVRRVVRRQPIVIDNRPPPDDTKAST
jgi:hypothetical protein